MWAYDGMRLAKRIMGILTFECGSGSEFGILCGNSRLYGYRGRGEIEYIWLHGVKILVRYRTSAAKIASR